MVAPSSEFKVALLIAERLTRQFPLRWLRVALCRELIEAGLTVAGVFVDRPPAKRPRSEAALIRKHGEDVVRRYQALQAEEVEVEEGGLEWGELGVPVYEVDLNSEEARATLRGLGADLGVLFGCRILDAATIEVPRLGTVNFHGRDAEVYRGGGALGYWELLEGESAIQITIHEAVAAVDAGAILAQHEVPIEPCDTLESLTLKVLLGGWRFYARVIVDVARGRATPRPQRLDRGRTYRRALVEETLFRRERQQVLRTMARYASAPEEFAGPALTAPAPRGGGVVVLSYPAIVNDASDPTNLPLEVFYAQIAWLRRHVQVVSLPEAVAFLQRGITDTPCVAIVLEGDRRHDALAVSPFLDAARIPVTRGVQSEAPRTLAPSSVPELAALFA